MPRNTAARPRKPAPEPAAGEERAALALREAAVLMAPVARWLLRSGVPFGRFADALKAVFVEAARAELERTGTRATYSALSVLSGVHRKDVRAIEAGPDDSGTPAAPSRGIPLASQVYTRWLTQRRYRARDGRPKPLPRTGSISFESLSRELSQDVHPRTVLDELLRLGLVRLDGERIVPARTAFTPSERDDELTALFSANAADHIAAAVHNLTAGEAPFLEQSVFADGLGEASVARLQALARSAWQSAFEAMVAEATQQVQADAALEPDAQRRMRFGVYFYSEPQPRPEPDDGPAAAAARTGRARRRSRR